MPTLLLATLLALQTASPATPAPTFVEKPIPPGMFADAHIPPQMRFWWRNLTITRVNPLGLINDARVSLRYRLYESPGTLLNNNFFAATAFSQVSPAFARVGAGFELQPASILTLWANYELVGFFGTFNLFQSFPTATADTSDSELDRRGDLPDGNNLKNFATTGHQLNAGADFQVKVGPAAVRSFLRFGRPDFSLRAGDRVFYDQLWDLTVPNRGWYMNWDNDLLWVSDFGLTAGARLNVANAFYGSEHVSLTESVNDVQNGPQARVGPLVAYTFWDDEGAMVDRPTIMGMVHWWVAHRWRTGADVHQAIPFVLLGFQVQGDLMPWKRRPNQAPEE